MNGRTHRHGLEPDAELINKVLKRAEELSPDKEQEEQRVMSIGHNIIKETQKEREMAVLRPRGLIAAAAAIIAVIAVGGAFALRSGIAAEEIKCPNDSVSRTEQTVSEPSAALDTELLTAPYREVSDEAAGYLILPDIKDESGKPYIDYPVMQHSDNEYYLSHSPDGSVSEEGSIFADCAVPIGEGERTDNITLYGHTWNNSDKTKMFTCLHDYEGENGLETLRQAPVILFGMLDEPELSRYLIIGVGRIDVSSEDCFDYRRYRDFDEEHTFDSWINGIYDNCDLLRTDGCTAEDDYLTLSTTVPSGEDGSGNLRTVVFARRMREGETLEDTEIFTPEAERPAPVGYITTPASPEPRAVYFTTDTAKTPWRILTLTDDLDPDSEISVTGTEDMYALADIEKVRDDPFITLTSGGRSQLYYITVFTEGAEFNDDDDPDFDLDEWLSENMVYRSGYADIADDLVISFTHEGKTCYIFAKYFDDEDSAEEIKASYTAPAGQLWQAGSINVPGFTEEAQYIYGGEYTSGVRYADGSMKLIYRVGDTWNEQNHVLFVPNDFYGFKDIEQARRSPVIEVTDDKGNMKQYVIAEFLDGRPMLDTDEFNDKGSDDWRARCGVYSSYESYDETYELSHLTLVCFVDGEQRYIMARELTPDDDLEAIKASYRETER